MDIKQILKELSLDFDIEGKDIEITNFASITEASKNDLTFCYYDENKAINYISNSNAGSILCNKNLKGKIRPKDKQQFIFLDNPRMVFVQILKKNKENKKISGVSNTTVIHQSAKIGKNCSIEPLSFIGEDCIIGNNCTIGVKVSLKNCIIGDNCIIQSGSTLGEDGFAYERYPNGKLEHFPHLGKVIIGNNVDVAANCSIARGSMINTTIGDGTKLDALVHIAHNVKIGMNCELTAGTIVGGSTKIGDFTWTGLNSTLKDNIIVGNNVIVGAGAMVINNVIDKDIVAGVPAKSIKKKVNTNLTFLMAGLEKENKDKDEQIS